MLFLSLSMFLGSPPWWRRLDLSGLNEPLQASKNPYSDFLKCFWQALKRLPSLTKMGSIKMADERNVFLLLPWFQFSISAASMQSLSNTNIKEIISANYSFSYKMGLWSSGDLAQNAEIRQFVAKTQYRTNTSFAFWACGYETQR